MLRRLLPEGIPKLHQLIPSQLLHGPPEGRLGDLQPQHQSQPHHLVGQLLLIGPAQLGELPQPPVLLLGTEFLRQLLQCGPSAQSFQHPGIPLGRHRHKRKFIGIHRLPQNGAAQLAVIIFALAVSAGTIFAAADGADGPPHGAAHADFFLDARLDVGDPLVPGTAPTDVGPGLDIADPILVQNLGVENPGQLSAGGPLVVHDAAFAHKEPRQLRKRLPIEPLKIPVHLVVAKPHREHIHLLLCQTPLRQSIDLLQLHCRRHPNAHRSRLFLDFHPITSQLSTVHCQLSTSALAQHKAPPSPSPPDPAG